MSTPPLPFPPFPFLPPFSILNLTLTEIVVCDNIREATECRHFENVNNVLNILHLTFFSSVLIFFTDIRYYYE